MSFKPSRPGRTDPGFPWLEAGSHFQFPPPATATPDGILCIGGNLSPGMLLSAYAQGVFPWFNDDDPLLWWSPDPRFIVDPQATHLSGTMRKLLRKQPFRLTLDTAFDQVIAHCASRRRPGQSGTWICQDMIDAYRGLHRLGYAHSAEAWQGEQLVGGLYGLNLGAAFFGESMFSLASDASKAVFLPLAWWLAEHGFRLIDSQVRTDHVAGLGGFPVSRAEYLVRLQACLLEPTRPGSWQALWPDYPGSGRYRRLLAGTTQADGQP